MNEVKGGLQVFRHELKYYINKKYVYELSEILNKLMRKDEYCDEKGEYYIRSLYFDTYNNLDYYNKIIGVSERKKIRLRLYDLEASSVKLEIKNRYGPYMMKETVTITREHAWELLSGRSNSLLSYQSSTANSVYHYMHDTLYRPTLLVDYEREAYAYPFDNIRVTIDKNVRVSTYDFNLFDKLTTMLPVMEADICILEIKYDNMIPIFLLNIISSIPSVRLSVSKYCMGRQII